MDQFSNRSLFMRYLAQTSDAPMALEVDRGEGIYLYGPDGKKYLDLISGIAVSALGHHHPEVVRAVIEQVNKHMHAMVYGEFIQTPQVKLAHLLAQTLPDNLDRVFMVNSGSEAIEGAVKLAKRHTGRFEIISFNNAYHGSTHGALSLSNQEYFSQAFRPLVPGIKRLDFGHVNDLDHITNKTAAVVIETIQGEAGVRVADDRFFRQLRQACTDNDTLLILDEIQCGFGRTGTFWAFEQYGIQPDILCTAKGMGGGMPLGAFISSEEIMSSLMHDPVLGHISTFGGHPVSCAASLATIQILLEQQLIQKVAEKARLFLSLLDHPAIQEIRHRGLMMAAQFESAELVHRIIENAAHAGLITDWFLFCEDAIRIAPPLIIKEEEIKTACTLLNRSIDAAI